MNRFTIAVIGAAASALVATPALAQDATEGPFTGARAGVTVGSGGEDIFDYDGETVGLELGYDAELNGVVAGVALEYQTDLGDDFLDVSQTALTARVGGKVGARALVYGLAGFSVVSSGSTPFSGDNEKGVIAGGGLEFLLGNSGTSLKIEQRYYNYADNIEAYQTLAGVNFRF